MGREHIGTVLLLGFSILTAGPAAAQQPVAAGPPLDLAAATPDQLNEAAFALYQAGRHAEAEPLFRRTVEAFERQYGAEHAETMNVLGNLANTIALGGRYAEAEPIMLRVMRFMEREYGPGSVEAARWANNLAIGYWIEGRYAEAEPLFLRSLEARERTLGRDHPNTLLVVPNLANVYLAQERFDEAEALYKRAAEDSVRLLGPDNGNVAGAIINLAGFYRLRGRYAEAQPLALEALRRDERLLGREHPNALITLNSVADLYRRQKKLGEAEPMFARAVEANARVLAPDHLQTQTSRFGLASIYLEQGRHEEAEGLARLVLEARSRQLGPANPDTLKAAELLAAIRLSRPATAPAALEPARLLLAGARSRRTSGSMNRYAQAQQAREERSWAGRLSLVADAAWAALRPAPVLRAELQGEAFASLQEAMAGAANRSIAQMAVRRYADQAGAGLGALVRERDGLDDQWAANLKREAATFAGGQADVEQRRAELAARRARIEARMDAIDTRLQSDFPDYFALVRPSPIGLEEAQRLLRPDEGLLLVLPTRFGTQIFALTAEQVSWGRSDWTADRIDAAVQRLRWDLGARVNVPDELARQWAQEDSLSSRARYHRQTAHDLYRELFSTAEPTLTGKKRLYVAAGGALSSLPFSVLVTKNPAGADDEPSALRATSWLGDAYALTHIPSIQSLAMLRRRGSTAAAGTAAFVGIGDPVLEGEAQQRGLERGRVNAPDAAALFGRGRTRSGAVLADAAKLRGLARLPGTAVELTALRDAFGSKNSRLLTAGAATEPVVRAADLSAARVLAFATHGLTSGEVQSVIEPGLVLTPPAQQSEEDDGYLAASEVAALRLDADWVILSACNTATGDEADGLSGLSRAFFYAGARSLLASHWPVADSVAPRLTVRTVELQRTGVPRAEAFRRAMREVRLDESADAGESLAHPFYWAPFVLIGDSE